MRKYLLTLLLCLISLPAAAQRVSDLPAVQLPLTGNELMSIDQNNVSKHVTTSSLMLGSLVLGIPSGGTGLSTVGPAGTCLQSNGLSLSYQACGSGGGGGGGTPGGSNGQIQYNNSGTFGGYTVGSGLSVIGGALVSTSTGAAAPAGMFPQIQVNGGMGNFAPLSTDTAAAFAAHNTIMNGLAYDPRDAAYGAICAGYNTYTGNGLQTVFAYTIPFTGSTPTDNTNFFVYYQPLFGGSATILNTTQFTVTGVNSGMGGNITLNSAVPNGQILVIAHDDGPGLVAASVASVASHGYVSVPNRCTIYTSQTNGTQLAEGAQLIGQGFTPNYDFNGAGVGPFISVITPRGIAPNFGFNVSGKSQQFFEGFQISPHVPGFNSLGFLEVPVLIGANGSSGAGGGQNPGIVVQYVTLNAGIVGFGAPIGGNSTYIFAALRFNNFSANTAGTFGPLSDLIAIGNDFTSNGAFGSFGSAGGLIIGPAQGALGAGGAAKVTANRFEFNSEGVVSKGMTLTSFDGNEFDGNSFCGLDLNSNWSHINVTGGWFRGNGNGGGSFTGSTGAGADAHVCINGAGNDLHIDNVTFLNGYGRGFTAPIGTASANTPLYFLDVNTAGSGVDNIRITNSNIENSFTNNGAYVTDFKIFRNGTPTNFVANSTGQAVQGGLVNGLRTDQIHGIPAPIWSAYNAFGDAYTALPNYVSSSQVYPALIGAGMGLTPSVQATTNAGQYDCDLVDTKIFGSFNPSAETSTVTTWLPNVNDPTFGGGFYQNHLADTNGCHLAGLTWLATPSTNKVFAQAATTTGTWGNFSSYGGAMGLTSTTQNSALTFTVTGQKAAYVNYELQATSTNQASGGVFSITVDGTLAATVSSGGSSATGAWTYNSGCNCTLPTAQAPAAVRVPLLGTTTTGHTIVTTVLSSTSTANPVTILGTWVPQDKPYLNGGPTVFFGGQLFEYADGFSAATAAFNSAELGQADQLLVDGVAVIGVNVRKYANSTTDMIPTPTSGSPFAPNATGQIKVQQAFGGAMQYKAASAATAASLTFNPKSYGAACNGHLFSHNYGATNAVHTTSGSPVISVDNYTFVDGLATQTGGGDVGKVIAIASENFGGGGFSVGPTTYILSVDTGANTATVGENMAVTTGGAQAVMGGYPTNPADPSTAVDDTQYILATANAATAAGAGGQVGMPPFCMVHNITLPPNTFLSGNNGGNVYINPEAVGDRSNTPLYITSNGYPEDPLVGINADNAGTQNVRLRDLTIYCPTFPSQGMTLSGIGSVTNNSNLAAEGLLLEHVSHVQCPVEYGSPLGWDLPVAFTATVSGTTMNVLAITSTNFKTQYGGNGFFNSDFLAPGRTVSGAGIPGGTVITSVPTNGLTGNYTINNSLSISTSEAMTSAGQSPQYSGTIRFNAFYNGQVDINGNFSDLNEIGSVFTGGFTRCMFLTGPSYRFSNDRYEECVAGAITLNGTVASQFNNDQWQFNGPFDIEVRSNTTNTQIAGGSIQGVDPMHQHILFNGTNINYFSLAGVQVLKNNFPAGNGTNGTSYIFATTTGTTADNVTMEGGDVQRGFVVGVSDFSATGGYPAHYKQYAPGIPVIDTTQSTMSITTSGAIGIGTTAATAGSILDMGLNNSTTNSSMILPGGGSSARPATPVIGMFRNNITTSNPEIYTYGWNPVYSAIPGYSNGMIVSNDATTPNTVIDISAGNITSDDNQTTIVNPFAYTKTTGAWAVGWGNGCLDTGTIANSTWYAVFAIERTDTSLSDYLCSTSATAPLIPAGYSKKQRVGLFQTDASAHILSAKQIAISNGQITYYKTAGATLDVNDALLSTTSKLETLNVPTGLKIKPICQASIGAAAGPVSVYLNSPDEGALAPTTTSPFSATPGYGYLSSTITGGTTTSNCPDMTTNTSAQITAMSSTTTTQLSIVNRGFTYCRTCDYSGVGNISIDAVSNIDSSTGTSGSLTISTQSGNDVIVIPQVSAQNGKIISAISDAASLTWALRSSTTSTSLAISEWWAVAPATLSSDAIALTYTTTGASYAQAVAIAGANTLTPFDPHSGIPATNTTGFGSFTSLSTIPTTTKAKGLVLNMFSAFGGQFQPAPSFPPGYSPLITAPIAVGVPSTGTGWYGNTSFSLISSPLAGGSITYSFPSILNVIFMKTDVIQASGQ